MNTIAPTRPAPVGKPPPTSLPSGRDATIAPPRPWGNLGWTQEETANTVGCSQRYVSEIVEEFPELEKVLKNLHSTPAHVGKPLAISHSAGQLHFPTFLAFTSPRVSPLPGPGTRADR